MVEAPAVYRASLETPIADRNRALVAKGGIAKTAERGISNLWAQKNSTFRG
jgi:hypothetical protein